MTTVQNDKVLTAGDVIYVLDRGSYNVKDPDQRIRKMNIVQEGDRLDAHAKDGYFTIRFEVTGKSIDDLNGNHPKHVFATQEEGENQYNEFIQKEVQAILDTPKADLLKQFYRDWCGEYSKDIRVYEAMEQKILNEFDVNVKE